MTAIELTPGALGRAPDDRLPADPQGRRFRVGVGLLTLLSLAARIAYVLATPNYVPLSDASRYFYRGLYLYRHHHLPPPVWGSPHARAPDAYWPPFYAIFMASVDEVHHWLRLVGIDLRMIELTRLVQALPGAAMVVLLALIARRLFGRRTALVAAALLAFYPPLIFVGGSLYSESLWLPLLLAAVAALVEYLHRPRLWMLVLAGLLTGLGSLTHSDGVYLLLPAVIALLVCGGVRRRVTWRRRLGRAAVYLGIAALTLAPWTIRNEVKFHAFIPIGTSVGNTLLGTYNAESAHDRKQPAVWINPPHIPQLRRMVNRLAGNDLKQDSVDTHVALRYIRRHPTYPFVVAYWNTVRLAELNGLGWAAFMAHWEGISHGLSNVAAYVFWVLGLLALVGCFTPAVRRGPKWIWLVPLTMYLGTVFVQSEVPRFRAPIDPFLIILAACALVTAWGRVVGVLGRRPEARGEYANA